ncbi:hypothetical protein [Halomicrobium salinisoli]|uniref:hypothetical protein n=1 Tax=Halomicrobium salinisoli TaxID=2878391 RepID=UPI001CF04257|nr:hypothetical protein [Halomicrobium salinisoli]
MRSWKQRASALSRGKELVLAFTAGLYVGMIAIVWTFAVTGESPDMSVYTVSTAILASIAVLVAWLGLLVFFVWTDSISGSHVDS